MSLLTITHGTRIALKVAMSSKIDTIETVLGAGKVMSMMMNMNLAVIEMTIEEMTLIEGTGIIEVIQETDTADPKTLANLLKSLITIEGRILETEVVAAVKAQLTVE